MDNSQKNLKNLNSLYKGLEKSLRIFGLKLDKYLSIGILYRMLKKL